MRSITNCSRAKAPAFIAAAACATIWGFPGASRAAEAKADLPTIFVVGDSTARNNANGAQGWGDPLASYFDASKVKVLNRAMAGRSSRTYIAEGRWDKVQQEMKAGDYVLIQMGHNDGGPIDTGRGRASLPGLGEESRELTKPDGSQETVRTYGWYMRKMVADAKTRGATPILLSLTVRSLWKDGHVERGSGNYRQMILEIAKSQGAAFVDVTNIIADKYEALGEEKVKPLFGPDYVHTSPAGADANAASVVAGLQVLAGAPFAGFLSEKGKAVAAAPVTVAATSPTNTAPASAAPAQNTSAPASAPAAPQARRPLPVPADPALPSLFLIGDSTVRNGQGEGGGGQWGWGEPLGAYFDQQKINVVNRAVGGLSSRTYFTGGFWDSTRAMLKPGDVLLMQFGHNDAGAINDATRARASLRGAGDESQEIDNLLTRQHETVHTYGWYLRRFISEAKALGALPIVCSPIPRKSWANGKVNRNMGTYGGWAAEVAKAEGVPFVNLNEIIARQYDALGPEKVEPLFADPNTHTSLAGAELNAARVVAGLKALAKNPVAPYFSPKAEGVAATDVAAADGAGK